VQAPVSVLILPHLQPIYSTTSQNVSYHIQLLRTLYIPLYFNIQWTTPASSSQTLKGRNISAHGRSYYNSFISLPNLSLRDRGRYTCYVQMTSPVPYTIASNFTMGFTDVIIKGNKNINLISSCT